MRTLLIAMIDVDTHPSEYDGNAFTAAMAIMKEAGNKIGTVKFYRVTNEDMFRKAEKEFEKQVRG